MSIADILAQKFPEATATELAMLEMQTYQTGFLAFLVIVLLAFFGYKFLRMFF